MEGKDEHGAGEHVPDPIQQPGSGRSIEALGRFVEQEDVGPSEKSLRYAEAPALAAGEGYAAGANWRFEPERERRHDIEGRRLECSPQVDVAGMGIGEKEVLPDGPVEDVGVLRDERHVFTKKPSHEWSYVNS